MARNRSRTRDFWRRAKPGYRTVTRRTLKRQHDRAEPYRPIEGRTEQPQENARWGERKPGMLPWENGAGRR